MVDGAFGFSMLGRFFSIVSGFLVTSATGGVVVFGVDVFGVADFAVVLVLGAGVVVFAVLPVFDAGVVVFAVLPFLGAGVVVFAVPVLFLGLLLEAVEGGVVFGTTLTSALRSSSVAPVPQLSCGLAGFHLPTNTSLLSVPFI